MHTSTPRRTWKFVKVLPLIFPFREHKCGGGGGNDTLCYNSILHAFILVTVPCESREATKREPGARGNNWSTLFLEDIYIYMGIWPSILGGTTLQCMRVADHMNLNLTIICIQLGRYSSLADSDHGGLRAAVFLDIEKAFYCWMY
jgi:hypothetical protein